jgi:hypothetical protein
LHAKEQDTPKKNLQQGCSNSFATSKIRSLLIPWLIQLNLKTARHAEIGHQPVAVVCDFLGELDAAGAQLANRLFDVVAIE